jgi:hypothetical protein
MYNQKNYKGSNIEGLVKKKLEEQLFGPKQTEVDPLHNRVRLRHPTGESVQMPEEEILTPRERAKVISPEAFQPTQDLFNFTMEKLDARKDASDENKEFDYFKDRMKSSLMWDGHQDIE